MKNEIRKAMEAVEKANTFYPVSFVTIYDGSELNDLSLMQDTLPNNSEWVVFEIVKDEAIKLNDYIVNLSKENKERYISGKILVNPNSFRFDNARNVAKQYATNEWIFSIDADERLQLDQHDFILDAINQNYDVIGCRVYDPFLNLGGTVPRLFKNYLKWRGACHEQITDGVKLYDESMMAITNILIRHDGYHKDKNRDIRNLKLMLKDTDNNTHPYWLNKIIDLCYKLKTKGN